VGEVDDDPGGIGELQDPEADPLGKADPGGGLAFEGAGGVDLAQGREVVEAASSPDGVTFVELGSCGGRGLPVRCGC
jgi:hypothetical protein